MFPGPKGGPCDSRRDWQEWRDACDRAGVPRVPLHGARGSAASLLADMGVPVFADFRGFATLSAVQEYGDFQRGRLTNKATRLMLSKMIAPARRPATHSSISRPPGRSKMGTVPEM